MSTALTLPVLPLPSAETLQAVLLGGDISRLAPAEKVTYYNRVCDSLGLNPLTKPFEFLSLNGKTVFYALKSCTEQLRQIHGVSLTIVSREVVEGSYVVTARATLPNGRTDESIGAVPLDKLTGEARSNALMKGETKAKRRVTLSICGLGMLDETEVDSISQATTKGQRQDRVVNVEATPVGPDATLTEDLKASVEAGQVEVIDAKTGEVTRKAKVTRDQLAKIHVLKAQGGYTDANWKPMLQQAYGTETSAKLSKDQASHLIEKLQRKVDKADEAIAEVAAVFEDAQVVEGPELSGVAGAIEDALSEPAMMASPEQVAEIGVELVRMEWKPMACAWWLKKHYGVERRDQLTHDQAMNALKVLMMLIDKAPCT